MYIVLLLYHAYRAHRTLPSTFNDHTRVFNGNRGVLYRVSSLWTRCRWTRCCRNRSFGLAGAWLEILWTYEVVVALANVPRRQMRSMWLMLEVEVISETERW